MVAAWEDQGENRRIAAMDGDGAVPDKMVAGLVQEMTGEQMLPPPMGELVGPGLHYVQNALDCFSSILSAVGLSPTRAFQPACGGVDVGVETTGGVPEVGTTE